VFNFLTAAFQNRCVCDKYFTSYAQDVYGNASRFSRNTFITLGRSRSK